MNQRAHNAKAATPPNAQAVLGLHEKEACMFRPIHLIGLAFVVAVAGAVLYVGERLVFAIIKGLER